MFGFCNTLPLRLKTLRAAGSLSTQKQTTDNKTHGNNRPRRQTQCRRGLLCKRTYLSEKVISARACGDHALQFDQNGRIGYFPLVYQDLCGGKGHAGFYHDSVQAAHVGPMQPCAPPGAYLKSQVGSLRLQNEGGDFRQVTAPQVRKWPLRLRKVAEFFIIPSCLE